MTYPPQPGAWSDPASAGGYIDPVTGQPAYPTSPPGYPPMQPGYGGYPGYPGYAAPVLVPAPQATNGMAIASLVLALCGLLTCGVTSLVGAILGHVARRQIKERGEGGEGMALAGIITGWILFALALVGGAAYIIFIVWLVRHTPDYPTTFPTS